MGTWTSDKPAVAGERDRPAGRLSGVLYISIVAAIDGARFAAVATSERDCVAQVAAYVAEQAPLQLWPRSAERVQWLLAGGNPSAAIAEYFRRVGERWDRERLATASLHPDSCAGIWAGPVPLPDPDRIGMVDLPN